MLYVVELPRLLYTCPLQPHVGAVVVVMVVVEVVVVGAVVVVASGSTVVVVGLQCTPLVWRMLSM
jgi:hypothetical protein